jgi:hypothetical protein
MSVRSNKIGISELVELINNIFSLFLFTVSYCRILKAITMILNGGTRLRCRDQKLFQIYCVSKSKMDVFQYSIKVTFFTRYSSFVNLILSTFAALIDLPAPCKIFPKTPKIALTIEDVPLSEGQRRKSSGSSVHSNTSTIEPHIYEFQESERQHVEPSSLVIR